MFFKSRLFRGQLAFLLAVLMVAWMTETSIMLAIPFMFLGCYWAITSNAELDEHRPGF